MWMRLVSMFAILSTLAGCRRPSEAETVDTGAPVAAIAPLASGMPLDSMLVRLESELDEALDEGRGEDAANERLVRAEAITDRLLDSRIPFPWLKTQNYSVDSRLRQIQALADRVIAQIESRGPRSNVITDANALRGEVRRLRAELAQGGTAAPPPLEELLASDTFATRVAPRPQPDTLLR
jgi:hypothetical protein